MTRRTFFEHAILERDLGDDLLELPVLASQVFDFVTTPGTEGPESNWRSWGAASWSASTNREFTDEAVPQLTERGYPLVEEVGTRSLCGIPEGWKLWRASG
jgi:hypothetical protein